MPGKNDPMSFSEMVAVGEQKKQNRLYREQTSEFSDQQISALVKRTARELKMMPAEKVSLRDIDRVKNVTSEYLRSCEVSSTLPTMSGLARSLGLTRQAIYYCIGHHSPAAAADWFQMCHDAFSDMLTEASLRGNVQPVVSIFVQKAMYGYNEKVEIVAQQQTSPLGSESEIEQADLERKLQDIVIDDI